MSRATDLGWRHPKEIFNAQYMPKVSIKKLILMTTRTG